MKGFLAIVMSAVVLGINVKAEDYYPGHWGESSIPKSIRTFEDLKRYEKARKAAITISIIGLVGAYSLHKYAAQVQNKADRVQIHGPLEQRTLSNGSVQAFYPIHRTSMGYRSRFERKVSAARQMGTGLAIASLMALGVSFSLRF